MGRIGGPVKSILSADKKHLLRSLCEFVYSSTRQTSCEGGKTLFAVGGVPYDPAGVLLAYIRGSYPSQKLGNIPGSRDEVRELTGENRDHLIIDLRGNIGGGLASLRLMSCLCADRRPIGYSLTKPHLSKEDQARTTS